MISTIYYVGSLYERETAGGTTTHRHHLYAGGQAIGQLKRTQAGVNSFEYFHRDHQGSVTKVTNGAGSVIQSLSFDAFGKRRNADWSADPPGHRFNDTHATKLGYTGHEHLDNVRLIHMNGRVQDPTLGRFISPDPFVQNPANSQNFDRFGYTYNNPLSYTDPTGFFFKKIGRSVKKLGKAVVKVAIQSLRSAMRNDIMLFVADTTGNSWLRLAAQVFTNFALDKAERKLVGSFNSTGNSRSPEQSTDATSSADGSSTTQQDLSRRYSGYVRPRRPPGATPGSDIFLDQYHSYSGSLEICTRHETNCSEQLAYEWLRYNAYPGQDLSRPVTAQRTEGLVKLKGVPIGTIQSFAELETLSIFNVTNPDHKFHDGYVRRWVEWDGDSLVVRTFGEGVNRSGLHATPNTLFGRLGFKELDMNIRESVRAGRRPEEHP